VTPARLDEEHANDLRECLASGGVAVFPTDTVYGLGCDPARGSAVERLYELKGRPADRPAAVMFFALPPALQALPQLGARERAAMRALLPGPVTLLLPNRGRRFLLACGPDPSTLGLRVPRLAGPLQALRGVSGAVMQSSANLSSGPDARRLAEVPPALREAADLVLDGGELPGLASTVVDLREFEQRGTWQVLREGPLVAKAVAQALAPC
jgi:L-threonylcarbamoyladenylate synthase